MSARYLFGRRQLQVCYADTVAPYVFGPVHSTIRMFEQCFAAHSMKLIDRYTNTYCHLYWHNRVGFLVFPVKWLCRNRYSQALCCLACLTHINICQYNCELLAAVTPHEIVWT